MTAPIEVIDIPSSSSENEPNPTGSTAGLTNDDIFINIISSDSADDEDCHVMIPERRMARLRAVALKTISKIPQPPNRPPTLPLGLRSNINGPTKFASEGVGLGSLAEIEVLDLESSEGELDVSLKPKAWEQLVQERLKAWRENKPLTDSDDSSASAVGDLKNEDEEAQDFPSAESSTDDCWTDGASVSSTSSSSGFEANPAGVYNEWAKWDVECCHACYGLCDNMFSINMAKLIFPRIRSDINLIDQFQGLIENPVIFDQEAPSQHLLKAEFMMPIISPVTQAFRDTAKDFARLIEFQGPGDLTEAEVRNLFGTTANFE